MTYYDLSIDKYLQMKKVLEECMEEDELETQVKLLCILYECSEDELLDLPLDEYKKKVSELSFLSEPVQTNSKCPKSIIIDGVTYECEYDIKKFTAGQYIDYQSLIKSNDFYSVIPNLLAVFFIPKGKDYGKDYDIMEVAEKIRYNVSIGLALDVCFFFRKKSLRSIRRMLDYLELMMKIQMRKTKDREMREKMRMAMEKIQQLRDSFSAGLGGMM